jgi:hypothetical protein
MRTTDTIKVAVIPNPDNTFNIKITTEENYPLEEHNNLTLRTVEYKLNENSQYVKISDIEKKDHE